MKKSWIAIAVLAVLSCLCVKYSDWILGFIPLLVNTVQPLIIGFMIAYVLDILMKRLERIYFPKKDTEWVIKTRRSVCVFASIALVMALVVFLFLLVIPNLRDAVLVLTKDIPKAFERFQNWFANEAGAAGLKDLSDFVLAMKIDWNSISAKLTGFLSRGIGSLFNSAFSVANVMISFVFTGVVSLIFAIYMLFQKETLRSQLKKLAAAYLPASWNARVEGFFHLAHGTFTSFISGQILEAFILGILCGLGMAILRLPYALMTGVIVGASALIPVMGAYIGACVGAFVILTVSPLKAVIFLIFLVILQQIEGNLIYPKVVGGSIGLPGIWVLAAVTVGGGLMGVPGMLLGVPLTATLYKWVRNDVNERLENNKVVRSPKLIDDIERK